MSPPSMASTSLPSRTHWSGVVVVYLAGVVAAMGLGKIASIGPLLGEEIGLTLTQVAWNISAVTAVGAVAGFPAAFVVRRLGETRSVLVGLALITVSGGAQAASGTFAWLFVTRLTEGAGYLLVVVACPVLVARLSSDRDRAAALSIWGTFIPVGLAVGTLAGGMLGDVLGWRWWLLVAAAATLVVAVAFVVNVPRTGGNGPGPIPRGRALLPPFLLAVYFLLVSMVTLAVLVLLPTYLTETHARTAGQAGAMTSAVSIVSVVGGLAAAGLLRRGIPLRALGLGGLAIVPAAAAVFWSDTLAIALTGAVVVSFGNGVLVAMVFAGVPVVMERLDQVEVGSGMVAQFGSLGSLVGPPLLTLAVSWYGWGAAAVVVGAGMAVALVPLLLIPLRGHRMP